MKREEENISELQRSIAIQTSKMKENVQKAIEKTISKCLSKSKKCLSRSHGLVRQQLRTKFVWNNKSDNAFKKIVETVLNSSYTIVINGLLTWSQWLLFTDEGQHLIELTVYGNSTQKCYGLATLLAYIVQVHITEGYDEGVFRREIEQMLPSLDPVFNTFPRLRNPIYRMLAGMINTKVFIYLTKQVMMSYGVPDKFFVDFEKIDSEETIYLGDDGDEKSE